MKYQILRALFVLVLLIIGHDSAFAQYFTVNGVSYLITSETEVAVVKNRVKPDSERDYFKFYYKGDYNYAYCWIENSDGSVTELLGGWPGEKMHYDEELEMYVVSFGNSSGSVPDYVIFNRGNVSWQTKDLKVKQDHVYENGTWTPFTEYKYSGDIIIPETVSYGGITYNVTSIADEAFYYSKDVTSVSIPNSVTVIGGSAFDGCTGLTSLSIGSGVTTIGGAAFSGCTGLTEITIPDAVTSIGSAAFSGCTGLTSLSIGSGVATIGANAFSGCSGLTSLTIPESVASIDQYAFDHCTNLKTLNYNASNCSFEYDYSSYPYDGKIYGPFNNTSITTINIGDAVRVIPEQAFMKFSNLTEVNVSEGVTSIGYRAFYNCVDLTEITIPNSVTSIDVEAFRFCEGVKSISIGSSVSFVGEAAFGSCHPTEVNVSDLSAWCKIDFSTIDSNPMHNGTTLKLKGEAVPNLVIPDDITVIKKYAFYNCGGLKSVVIPNSVTSIGKEAFYDCSGLNSVSIGNTVSFVGDAAFGSCHPTEVNVTDLSAWCKIDFSTIDSNPMHNGTTLKLKGEVVSNLVIPDDITVIKKYAFYNSDGLKSVVIPNSVTLISAKAFEDCSTLGAVTLGESVESIEVSAFNCGNIRQINSYNTIAPTVAPFPLEVKENATLNVPASALASYQTAEEWKDFKNIQEFAMNDVYDFEVDGIYYRIISLTDLTVKVVAKNTNFNTYSGEIVIPETVTYRNRDFSVAEIGELAFFDCKDLTSVTIPATVNGIHNSAFRYCEALEMVNIADGENVLNTNNCFANHTIKSLYLGRNMQIIHYSDINTVIGAFTNNYNLTEVKLGDYVTEINAKMFFRCSKLSSIELSENVSYIGEEAFYGCSSLTELVIPDKVTMIGSEAFYGCSSLTELTISKKVTEIGEDAFDGCINLSKLIIKSGEGDIDAKGNTLSESPLTSLYLGRNWTNVTSPFANIKTLEKITIGENVTSLSSDAFTGCTSVRELILEGGDADIAVNCTFADSPIEKLHIGRSGTYAFNNRIALKEVSVGDKVTSIPDNAFNGCSNITTLKLGNKLETIGSEAFTGCATLMNVYSTNLTPPVGVVFENKTYMQGTLYVVKGCKDAYMAADGWKEFWVIEDNLPFEVNGIWYNVQDDGSVRLVANPSGDCYSGEVVVPAKITYQGVEYIVSSIDADAFADAINITSVVIEDSEHTLVVGSPMVAAASAGDEVGLFEDCSLESVYVGRNLNYSVDCAPFACQSSLREVTIGDKVTSMGGAMFAGAENITTVKSNAATPPADAEFEMLVYNNATLIVPVGALDAYKAADGWKEFFNIQDANGNSEIGDLTIDGSDVLPEVVVVNGEIIVNGGAEAQIAVYNINGALLYHGANKPVAVAQTGVYIVVVDGIAVKVLI